MTLSDSLEFKIAQQEVQFGRAQVQTALAHLEEKLYEGTQQVQQVIDKATFPIRYTRQNPFAAAAICAGAGFLVGMILGRPKQPVYVIRDGYIESVEYR